MVSAFTSNAALLDSELASNIVECSFYISSTGPLTSHSNINERQAIQEWAGKTNISKMRSAVSHAVLLFFFYSSESNHLFITVIAFAYCAVCTVLNLTKSLCYGCSFLDPENPKIMMSTCYLAVQLSKTAFLKLNKMISQPP